MLAWIYGNFLGLTKAHRQKIACTAPKTTRFFRTKIISASYSIFAEETTPSIKSMFTGGARGDGGESCVYPSSLGKNHSIQLTILHFRLLRACNRVSCRPLGNTILRQLGQANPGQGSRRNGNFQAKVPKMSFGAGSFQHKRQVSNFTFFGGSDHVPTLASVTSVGFGPGHSYEWGVYPYFFAKEISQLLSHAWEKKHSIHMSPSEYIALSFPKGLQLTQLQALRNQNTAAVDPGRPGRWRGGGWRVSR